MDFKFILFTFCLLQAQDWHGTIVSAYPQPINAPKDDTQSKHAGGNKEVEAEVVEFQITQNQVQENDVCLEKKLVGPCKAFIPKHFYNKGTGRCEVFLYGGCAGSNNRFDSLRDCEQQCAKHLRTQEPITVHNDGEQEQLNSTGFCELPHTEEGSSCQGYLPRWTYNASEGKCVQFMFQGCGATKNNFRAKSLCEKACGDYKQSSETGNLKSGLKEVCKLPMNPGPCYALYDRYYFNQVNNRCERFGFGGCAGNENNFRTADECVRTCGGDEPAHDASCSNVDCPWSRYTHYTALGCTPIYDSNSCCPTRFDCPDSNLTAAAQSEPKCRYHGNLYAIGETIKDAASMKDCRASCTCVSVGNKAKIQCVSIECPEQLGVVPPGKESCHRLYKRGGCCVDNYYCPNDPQVDEPVKTGLPPPPPVEPYECHFEGKTYYEGERIYPQKSKCLACICQKGFNGNLTEEFCHKIDCGIEIYYSDKLERGCAPVYLQDTNGVDNCCPITWECPDEQRITLPAIPTPNLQPPPSQTSSPPILGPITILPIPFGTSNATVQGQGRSNEQLTVSVCKLPKEVGPCRAHRPRFFFNTATNKCENFTYGGCQGNQNNFVALSDCERVCEANTNLIQEQEEATTQVVQIMSRAGQIQIQPVQPELPTTYKLSETDPCEQPKRTGPCRAYLPRYYFSPEENSCKFFVFGGCRGNENNFYSQAACEAKCQNRLPQESVRFDQTQSNRLRSAPGDSNGDSTRVTFEINQDQTQQSQHQRPTDFKIIDVTPPKSICSLPAVTGRCKAHIRRFYFDGTQCSLFTYGGCGGNANNFRNFDECNSKCGGGSIAPIVQQQAQPPNFKSPKWRSAGAQTQPVPEAANQNQVVFDGTERCQLPAKVGSCYGQFKAYYYDAVSRACQNFTYGGCFGNTNRFVTLEECKVACERPLALERQNELTFARIGGGGDDHDAVAHILPITQPDDDQEGGQIVQGRQLMPGEVIVIQPKTSSTQEPEPEAEAVTTGAETDDDVLEEKVFCGLPAEQGPCKGNELRYFWDSNSRACLPFFYGGCRGNKNNFLSESDCLSVCGAGPTLEQMTQDGLLSCSFGNETFALGVTLGQSTNRVEADGNDNDGSDNGPCGVPICSCQTPPTLTCIQKACDNPAQRVTLPRVDSSDGSDNNNEESDNASGHNEFEIQRVSVPAVPVSSTTPSWSKPVEKIVKW